jgi:hypothetical protein
MTLEGVDVPFTPVKGCEEGFVRYSTPVALLSSSNNTRMTLLSTRRCKLGYSPD